MTWKNRTSGSPAQHPCEKLVCAHGELRPVASSNKEKRVLLPGTVWRFLEEEWQAGRKEQQGGSKGSKGKGNATSHPGTTPAEAKPIEVVELESPASAKSSAVLQRALEGFPETTADCEMCAALLLSTSQLVRAPLAPSTTTICRIQRNPTRY
jgi:hypothetical protein